MYSRFGPEPSETSGTCRFGTSAVVGTLHSLTENENMSEEVYSKMMGEQRGSDTAVVYIEEFPMYAPHSP